MFTVDKSIGTMVFLNQLISGGTTGLGVGGDYVVLFFLQNLM
jgi:hypothetical protein